MIPVGYVVGGAVLFGIGYVTYEIIEGAKKISKAVEEVPTPFETANNYAQSLSTSERVGLYAIQPLGLTLAELAYNEF